MNETLQKATQLLQNGEAEEALLLLNELEESSTEIEQLMAACRKALSNQYLWLLNDAVKNKQYAEYDKYVSRYLYLIGNDESITQFVNMQDEIHKERNFNNKKEFVIRIKELFFKISEKIKSNRRIFALTGGAVLLLIVILICLANSEGNAHTDVERNGLIGNVKYIAVYHYSVDEHYAEEPIRFYDEKGIVDYTESYYNTNGMLEKYCTVWDIYKNTDYYTYEDGLLKEIKHSFNDERDPESTVFAYDDNKRVCKRTRIEEDDYSECYYTYDNRGNIINDGEYDYKYDRKGRLIEKSSKNYCEQVLSYYRSGKRKKYWIKEIDPYEDISYTRYSVKYDKKGRIIEKSIEDGLVDVDGITTYEYAYSDDEKGNWIERYEYVDGRVSGLIRRNIEYHDENTESQDVYKRIVKNCYEEGLPCRTLLFIPEIKEYIVNTKSQKFYDLAVKYTDEYAIFHRNPWGYYAYAVNEETGNGTKMFYDFNFNIGLFLVGQPTTNKGEFNIHPWEKGYYRDYYGEIDESSPVYYLTHPFRYHSESGQPIIENIELRIDGNGLRFICPSFSKYSRATFRVIKSNGSGWKIPINYTKELVHIGWDNDWVFTLLKLLQTEESTIEIECSDYAGNKRIYSAEFSPMKQVELVLLEYMFEVGAITDIAQLLD